MKFAFPDFSCLISSKISRRSSWSRFFFQVDISLVPSLALSESITESLNDKNSSETVNDDQSVTLSLISQTSTTNQRQWRPCLLGLAFCHSPKTDTRNSIDCSHQIRPTGDEMPPLRLLDSTHCHSPRTDQRADHFDYGSRWAL